MGHQCPHCHTILDDDGAHRCPPDQSSEIARLRLALRVCEKALNSAYSAAENMTPDYMREIETAQRYANEALPH